MRIRQMGFSSRLKAHKNILTLETLKFIVEYLVDGNAKQAALENDLDEREIQKLQKMITEIQTKMENCKQLLGIA